MTASTTLTGPGRSGPEIRAALAEQNQIRRAQAGDYSGLYEQVSDGTFRRVG